MGSVTGADGMLDQIDKLQTDLPILVDATLAALLSNSRSLLRTRFEKVTVTGCGDSLQAAFAAAPAFARLAMQPLDVMGPRRLIADLHAKSGLRRQLVIGISASGGTPAVCQALEKANAAGALTLAIVGRENSKMAALASETLLIPLPDAVVGPGIRTYQASLVGLFLLAVCLGFFAGRSSSRDVDEWPSTMRDVAKALGETIEATKPVMAGIAQETADFPAMFFLAAGQHLATARYAAAKRVEASGLYATGQDLEEAWHIERFARPRDLPVAVIAPPGATLEEAEAACCHARGIGRRVFVLTCSAETAIRQHATVALDLSPPPFEFLAPFVCHPVFTQMAAHEALLLGCLPFRADSPEIAADLAAYMKSAAYS
ncbi:SIS domain-containing protein [Neorhizobium sp. BETTINA12A]|uniref:SIS domain-containing protein n=1 Tax=Neorhizobium sp. BETTINA12A TaxID=2908924 RepID=UPI001FF39262|nr:SIS domain-containing protein [Neorhizobium sp. BETTINA12A]MCJ9750398.1 SIS domain-containing protein [Neorhizobium sp. BETTINA12A]